MSVAKPCPTLLQPMDYSLPGSSVHGIFQARILGWVAISFSRESSWARDPTSSGTRGFCLTGRFFTTGHQGSPVYVWLIHLVIQQKLTEHCKANIIVVIQLLSCVQLFSTPWTAACQASLSINNSQSLLKLMSIEFMIPFSSCPQSFPELGSFSVNWLFASGGQRVGASASASVLPISIQGLFPLGWLVWSLCCPRDSRESSSTFQFKSINSLVLSLLYIQLTSVLWRRQW